MSDLFDQPAAPEPAKPAVQQLFVDEAGTSAKVESAWQGIFSHL
jgi:hypothetical protein